MAGVKRIEANNVDTRLPGLSAAKSAGDAMVAPWKGLGSDKSQFDARPVPDKYIPERSLLNETILRNLPLQ